MQNYSNETTLDVCDFIQLVAYLLDAWVAKFLHFAAFAADQVVVLVEEVCLFELGLGTHEPVSTHEVTADQQVHGIVTRRSAHAVVLQFHTGVKPFDVEMPFLGIHFIQYREAFGCFSVPVQFEIRTEDALDIGSLFRHHHCANVRFHAGPVSGRNQQRKGQRQGGLSAARSPLGDGPVNGPHAPRCAPRAHASVCP